MTTTRDSSRTAAPIFGIAAACVMSGAIAYAASTDVRMGLLVRDPNQLSQARAWTGIVSTLGNSLWAVSVGALILALVVKRAAADQRAVPALTALLALSTVLLLDDSLLLHDEVLPSFGIPEILIVGAYGVAGAGTLYLALPLLLQLRLLPLFALSIALFATSIGIDLVEPSSWSTGVLFGLEDGAKFIGIGVWSDVMIRLARSVVAPSVGEPSVAELPFEEPLVREAPQDALALSR